MGDDATANRLDILYDEWRERGTKFTLLPLVDPGLAHRDGMIILAIGTMFLIRVGYRRCHPSIRTAFDKFLLK